MMVNRDQAFYSVLKIMDVLHLAADCLVSIIQYISVDDVMDRVLYSFIAPPIADIVLQQVISTRLDYGERGGGQAFGCSSDQGRIM